MDRTSGTTPIGAPTGAPAQEPQGNLAAAQPADGAHAAAGPSPAPAAAQPAGADPAEAGASQGGFQSRGRARRRVRFLRKARELAYRDLGGLVFNLHRFGQRNDTLVLAKLTTLGHIDAELRAIETTLGEHRSVTVLREAGIAACPRCAAIHSSEDNFCPNCGLSLGRHADLPAGFQSGAGVTHPPSPAAAAAQPATPVAAQPVPAAAAQPATPEPPAPPAPAPAPVPSPSPLAPPHEGRTGVGRAPTPPTASRPKAAEQPAPAGPAPGEEEGPTEILRPSAPRR